MSKGKVKIKYTRHLGSTVFTTGQIAGLCAVAPRTVSKWFDSGKIKGYRIPGSNDRRVPRAELARFLAENGMPADWLTETGVGVLLAGLGPGLVPALRGLLPAADGWRLTVAPTAFDAGRAFAKGEPPVHLAVIDHALGRAEALAVAGGVRRASPDTTLVGLLNEDEAGPDRPPVYDLTRLKPVDAVPLAEVLRNQLTEGGS